MHLTIKFILPTIVYDCIMNLVHSKIQNLHVFIQTKNTVLTYNLILEYPNVT